MAVFHMENVGNYEVVATPRIVYLHTEDDYSTITTAGYANKNSVMKILPGDLICAYYDTTGINGWFTTSIDSSGIVTLAPLSTHGEVSLVGTAVSGNLPMFSGTTGDIEDSDIAAEDILTVDTDVDDYQQFVSIQDIILSAAGTWTKTRIAQGNYVYRHTDADDTSILGIDITPQIRAAADRGFSLESIDVIYSVGTLALEAHSMTLDKTSYANNAAVTITSVALTGSLATATQANPYLTNLAVTTPAFDNTSASKYVAELTVNAAATSVYDFYGLNLHFTKSAA